MRISSKEELLKTDFLTVADSSSQIEKIVSPNSLEIGLPQFPFNKRALTINGLVHIKSERATTPGAPKNGRGGVLYAKADGKIYWRSHDVAETDLTGGGSTASAVGWTGPAASQIDTTGSLGVSGSLYVAEYLYHIGDTDTYMRFTDDTVRVSAGGKVGFSLSEGTTDKVFIGTTHNAAVGAANKYDQVLILSGGAAASTNEASGTDIALYVSGTAGSKGSTTKGTALFGGDVVVSGTLYAERQVIEVDEAVTGSLSVSGSLVVSQSLDIRGAAVFNELGQSNDFRVETANEDEAFFIDGSADTIYINKGASSVTTVIKNTNEEAIRVGAAGIIFNEYGHASMDFRVESDSKPNAFFVDAGTNQVLVLSGGSAHSANESVASDINFYVSGTVGSRNSTTRGTTVFGGDVYVSGSLSAGGAVRAKTVVEVTGTHITGTPLDAGTADFSTVDYNFNKIDVFLNGQLLASGSGADYTLLGSKTGSVNFDFALRDDDMITVVIH
jgi:cytoskeletal protein CcmA (bactofilin family)